MKTVIIYDQCGEAAISFLVVDCDCSHLDGCYMNSAECDEDDAEELDKLIHEYGPDGEFIRSKPLMKSFPVAAVKKGAKVIVCGFIP